MCGDSLLKGLNVCKNRDMCRGEGSLGEEKGLSVPRSITHTHVYITWRSHLLVAQSVTHTVPHTPTG